MVKLILEKKPIERRESFLRKHHPKPSKVSGKKVMTLADTPFVPKDK